MTAPHRGLDTTADLTPHLDMMVREGIDYASQYIARAGGLNKARADAIRSKGVHLILNFEGRGNDINAFSAALGTSNATAARNVALALGAPPSTAIYFSCEPENYGGDLKGAYNSRVLPYWRAAKAAIAPYRIGAYTFGTWLDWLLRDEANEFNWLPNATGWPGYQEFLASSRWHYRQFAPGNVKFNDLLLDWDEPNPSMTDIGAWAPSGAPVTLPNPPSDFRTLRKGSTGEDVRTLQAMVGAVVDGDFGPKTEAAVKAFQSANGLKPDGIVGPLTWAALQQQRQGV